MPTRRSTFIRPALALLAGLLAIQGGVAGAQVAEGVKPESLTTLSKVYAAEQATKGKDTFLTSCVSCHQAAELAGEKFWTGLVGKTVADFFSYLRNSMPQNDPGSMGDDDYVNVTAYILQLNTMPAGERPLTGDTATLARIRVVPPDTTRKGPGK